MIEKQAILVVSFGTSFPETRKKTIDAIEGDIAAAYPHREVRRAFTSGMILRVLEKRDGIHIDGVTEAMERLEKDGFTQVTVQPTHIMHGDEYEKMRRDLAPFQSRFARITVGAPLLSSSEDFREVVSGVMGYVGVLKKDEMLVFMGHGTTHHTDAVYGALDYRFKAMGYDHVVVATVEGYPTFDQVLEQLERKKPSKVWLMPLMVVAGDHATNDLAGEKEDSWKCMLEAKGYDVSCKLVGLGEMPAIRRIYQRHLEAVEPSDE